MFSKNFKISNLNFSENSKVIIIAEIGINHEGNFSKCIEMINESHRVGPNFVKLQVVDPYFNYEKKQSHSRFSKNLFYQMKIYSKFTIIVKKKINIFFNF